MTHTPNPLRTNTRTLPGLTLLAFAGASSVVFGQAPNLVQNGNFATTSTTGTASSTASYQIGYNGFTLNGWSNGTDGGGNLGYNFLFQDQGATPSYQSTATGNAGSLSLWNSASTSVTVSHKTYTGSGGAYAPYGGHSFIAADPVYDNAALSQTITNLTVGKTYNLTFYWAAAQQYGSAYIVGTTNNGWQVSLGGTTLSTVTTNNPATTFGNWNYQTFSYTATTNTEVLSFLAVGSGAPPFCLLADVYLSVPEASTSPALVLGLAAVAGVVVHVKRRRRQ